MVVAPFPPAAGLDLSTAAKAYAGLVNVFSAECTTLKRVAPGAPDMSYLIWKLDGFGPCFFGSRMPLVGLPLSASQVATIRAWIVQGAPNN